MAKEDLEDWEEETIYEEDGREDLVDADGMSAEEEGFMRGYEEADGKPDEVDAEPEEDIEE